MGFEYIVIGVIILLQVFFWYGTFMEIRRFATFLPNHKTITIKRYSFLQSTIETIHPETILNDVSKHEVSGEREGSDQIISMGLITGGNLSVDFRAIAGAINTYLLRNSGAAADFNLMKDISERQNDAIEDKIASSVSVPLYLGLLGTLAGIVIGLFNISDISEASSGAEVSDLLDNGISTLLGGVKIAMIASLCGLGLTVINNAWFYKRAKAANSKLRNDFYTFLQVELLPVINQNLDSTLRSLQANLLSFNDGFGKNMHKLDGLMGKNYDALISQSHLLDSLQELDMMQMAQANVKVLKELRLATQSFEGFNAYLSHVQSIFNGVTLTITKINEFLDRTKNLESLAESAVLATDQNRRLAEFLQSHYSELDKSRQLIANSVGDVNGTIQQALGDLENFTRQKIEVIRSIEVTEEARIAADYQHRWEALDNLNLIATIPLAVESSAGLTVAKLDEMKKELVAMRKSMIKELVELKESQKTDDSTAFEPNVFFSKLFLRKKTDVNEEE